MSRSAPSTASTGMTATTRRPSRTSSTSIPKSASTAASASPSVRGRPSSRTSRSRRSSHEDIALNAKIVERQGRLLGSRGRGEGQAQPRADRREQDEVGLRRLSRSGRASARSRGGRVERLRHHVDGSVASRPQRAAARRPGRRASTCPGPCARRARRASRSRRVSLAGRRPRPSPPSRRSAARRPDRRHVGSQADRRGVHEHVVGQSAEIAERAGRRRRRDRRPGRGRGPTLRFEHASPARPRSQQPVDHARGRCRRRRARRRAHRPRRTLALERAHRADPVRVRADQPCRPGA